MTLARFLIGHEIEVRPKYTERLVYTVSVTRLDNDSGIGVVEHVLSQFVEQTCTLSDLRNLSEERYLETCDI